MADLISWRERLVREVRQLRDEHIVHDLSDDPGLILFYLPYQGLNDREIQQEIARLYRAPIDGSVDGGWWTVDGKRKVDGGQWTVDGEAKHLGSPPTDHRPPATVHQPPSTSRKIRVGFLSAFLGDHTIGLLMGGMAAKLSHRDFSVNVLSVGQNEKTTVCFFNEPHDYLVVPRYLPLARRLIAKQRLDILFYTDIGMDPFTSALAFSRLAPVQCVTWGHPVTTGIETLDYFISSEALETEGAEQHYSERLVRLKNLPIYYDRPKLSAPLKQREDFGLGKDARIYACLQSLFKFHPEFDPLVGAILRGDPQGVLVLLQGSAPGHAKLLRQRFQTTLPDVLDRIHFVGRLDRADFLQLTALSDVLLDPLHFGGGNTSYEALAFGVPIVTLPSRFLRGRITYALYHRMQVMDCIALSPEDYVEKALRLGTDSVYRKAIREKMLAANSVLFENEEGIRELEGFFKEAVKSPVSSLSPTRVFTR
jgi:predicted O-linked N-acetylglucosamine transferase (SPINDLY family)